MTRLGFLTSLTTLILALLVSGRSNGAPRSLWRYEGDGKTFSPFVRDLSDEEMRLYNDVFLSLNDDLVNYEEGLKHEDERERFIYSVAYTSRQDVSEQLEPAISGPMESHDNGARQIQIFVSSGDDTVVDKRRNSKEEERKKIIEICRKSDAFGNWLPRLCINYS